MRIAVLASPESWYLRDLRRAAGSDSEIVPVRFTDLRASVGGESDCGFVAGATDLASCDAALVRTMPPGSLEQVVVRMDMLNRMQKEGMVVVNSARAVEASVDKYLATCKLKAAGLPVPRTFVCQTADGAMDAFQALGGDVVIKPLFGGEGRGITRVTDLELAGRAFKLLEQMQAVIYLQEFVDHDGADYRILVVGEDVLAIRRRNPLDWRTNVSRGARAEPLRVDSELRAMARRAADTLGASIAGVDVLPGRDGRRYLLEVNAVPGWKALALALDVDVGRLILRHLHSLRTRT
jgi:tetrahydromethanopterin:alpha-L-glutamate ligase